MRGHLGLCLTADVDEMQIAGRASQERDAQVQSLWVGEGEGHWGQGCVVYDKIC